MLNEIFIRILIVFFIELEKRIQNSYGSTKTLKSQSNLQEKEPCWWSHSDSSHGICHGAMATKSRWLTQANTWTSFHSEINAPTQLSYSHLIFDEGVKNTLPKKTVRSENAWNAGYSHVKGWEQWAGNAAPLLEVLPSIHIKPRVQSQHYVKLDTAAMSTIPTLGRSGEEIRSSASFQLQGQLGLHGTMKKETRCPSLTLHRNQS